MELGAGGRVLPGYLLSSGQASGAVGGLVVGGGGQVTIGPLYSSGLADSRDTISASKKLHPKVRNHEEGYKTLC